MPNDALAPVGEREGRMRSHEGVEFRLDRLGDQPTGARAQDFGERIVDFAFLPEGDNSILGHGVTLLREVRAGLVTNPVTPPSSHRHPVSRVAPQAARTAHGRPPRAAPR